MEYISKNIEEWQKKMIYCPFCGSDKIKITVISKGNNKGNKMQGLCNRCYGRGPVSDNPRDATLLWNGRNGELIFKQFTLDNKQLKRVLTEDVILNPTSEFEMKVILNTMSQYSSSFKTELSYLWGAYEKYTAVFVKGSNVNKEEYWFEFSSILYAEEEKPQATLEIPKIVRIK